MRDLILILAAIAACLVFGTLAAVVCAIFQLSLAGLETLAARRRRRRAARRPRSLSGGR